VCQSYWLAILWFFAGFSSGGDDDNTGQPGPSSGPRTGRAAPPSAQHRSATTRKDPTQRPRGSSHHRRHTGGSSNGSGSEGTDGALRHRPDGHAVVTTTRRDGPDSEEGARNQRAGRKSGRGGNAAVDAEVRDLQQGAFGWDKNKEEAPARGFFAPVRGGHALPKRFWPVYCLAECYNSLAPHRK
jgi:hypothetical protein